MSCIQASQLLVNIVRRLYDLIKVLIKPIHVLTNIDRLYKNTRKRRVISIKSYIHREIDIHIRYLADFYLYRKLISSPVFNNSFKDSFRLKNIASLAFNLFPRQPKEPQNINTFYFLFRLIFQYQ